MENNIALKSKYYGAYFRANKNTICKNCTALENGFGGFAADKPSMAGDGSPTVYFQNTLAVNNKAFGNLIVAQAEYKIEFSNADGHSYDFYPKTSSKYNNISSDNAGLGSCKVFIPYTSRMRGKGKDRADIGANVLYRYEKGVLTGKPLWDPSSGEFTCGAKVAGVNDIAGSSCFDVHERLNVNVNNCSLPANYGF
jgi:hypothetical protein